MTRLSSLFSSLARGERDPQPEGATKWQGSGLTLADFWAGDRVTYLPIHANGDTSHPDAERGLVSSVGSRFVFVRFYGKHALSETAQACDPDDLVKL